MSFSSSAKIMGYSKRFPGFLLFITFLQFVCCSQAYKFFVGGKDGWVLNPSENFNHWAERNRFQVNDILFFRYKQGSDSVLVVTKDDYYSCNTKNPISSLTNGDSDFKFDRSGPFFFITGNVENCQKGQKLHAVVLAVRNKRHHGTTPPSPSPSPSPALMPRSIVPTPTPSAESESPAQRVNPSVLDGPTPALNEHSGGPAGSGQASVLFNWLGFCASFGVSVVFGSF